MIRKLSIVSGKKRWLMPFLRRTDVVRDRNAATAIEFAIIAPIFFALIFSIFEIGLLFTRMAMIDHSVDVISKAVYTGEVAKGVAGGTVTQADIEKAVCERTALIFPNCEKNITVELTEISSLSSLPTTDATCQDATLEINPAVSFNPGNTNSIVFMRVCMTVNVLTPGLGLGLSLQKTTSDRYELISSIAFMNEPF